MPRCVRLAARHCSVRPQQQFGAHDAAEEGFAAARDAAEPFATGPAGLNRLATASQYSIGRAQEGAGRFEDARQDWRTTPRSTCPSRPTRWQRATRGPCCSALVAMPQQWRAGNRRSRWTRRGLPHTPESRRRLPRERGPRGRTTESGAVDRTRPAKCAGTRFRSPRRRLAAPGAGRASARSIRPCPRARTAEPRCCEQLGCRWCSGGRPPLTRSSTTRQRTDRHG